MRDRGWRINQRFRNRNKALRMCREWGLFEEYALKMEKNRRRCSCEVCRSSKYRVDGMSVADRRRL